MINVAIVDDEEKERLKLRDCLSFMEKRETRFCIYEFSSSEEFLLKYEPVYDIVFLDIQMGQTNGLEAAKALRRIDETVIIVFVTYLAQLAVRGYEVDAVDFMVKPVDKLSFALKMRRILQRLPSNTNNSVLIKCDGDLISVNTNSLHYIEVDGHYIVYHTEDAEYREYITLSAAEKKIGGANIFVRCNRGQLVNLRFVTAVKKDTVQVGHRELALARTQRNAFINAFANYMARGTRRGG